MSQTGYKNPNRVDSFIWLLRVKSSHSLVFDPRKLFENGQFNAVPTMIGMTKDEGLLRSHAFYENADLFNYFL